MLNSIRVMALTTPAARVNVALQEPDRVVERAGLIRLMADRAQQAGAQLYWGACFQGLTPHSEGAVLHLKGANGQEITAVAQAVIGADGVSSDVAISVGLQRPLAVSIIQAEVALPPGWDTAITQVWFDTDETRFFYWLIPESAERAVVGLVGDDGAETRAGLQWFLERHGFEPLAYQGAQVAMYHPRLRPWGYVGTAPVLLVGDAAGQVKVTTVGGTVTGLWGARAAAQAILQGTSYAHALRPLKRELDLHWYIRALLERLDNSGYDQLIRCITPAVRDFLSLRTRDEVTGVFWRLPFLQPRLLLLGLRLLLRRLHL
jgi:flavin-dependent dehydrogenase